MKCYVGSPWFGLCRFKQKYILLYYKSDGVIVNLFIQQASFKFPVSVKDKPVSVSMNCDTDQMVFDQYSLGKSQYTNNTLGQ